MIRPSGTIGSLKKSALTELGRKITSNRENARVILFPGVGAGSGATTLVSDLARHMAMEGHKVLLVDTDMRKDKLADILNPERSGDGEVFGLCEYLMGMKTIDDVFYMTDLSGLCVVFSGKPAENSVEALGSERFTELINLGTRYFDYILIDCAPVDLYRDAFNISNSVDAVMPVVEWKKATGCGVEKAAAAFDRIGVPVLGYILDEAPVGNSLMGRFYRKLLG